MIDQPKSATRQEKHVEIWNSLNNLERAIEKLETLNCDIQEGQEKPTAEDKPRDNSQPTLAQFLSDGKTTIGIYAERIDKTVQSIKELIF